MARTFYVVLRIEELSDEGARNKVMAEGWDVMATSYGCEVISPVMAEGDIPRLGEVMATFTGYVFREVMVCVDASGYTPTSARVMVTALDCRRELVMDAFRCGEIKVAEPEFLYAVNMEKPKTWEDFQALWEELNLTKSSHLFEISFVNKEFKFRLPRIHMRVGYVNACVRFFLALMEHYAKSSRIRGTSMHLLDNPLYYMRVWLYNLGFGGAEFAGLRSVLLDHLSGNRAYLKK